MPHTATDSPWIRQRLRVPRENRSLYAVPNLNEAAAHVSENKSQFAAIDADVQGKSLSELRNWARRSILTAAIDYTRSIVSEGTTVSLTELPEALVVTGHQPALFHPGVWCKNFATARLAQQFDGVGLNLIVDNDTFSNNELRVPTGTGANPAVERVAFDANQAPLPWEEATIADRRALASFPNRVEEALSGWGYEPMLPLMWRDVMQLSESHHRLSDCFSGARHRAERRWGCENLEIPFSEICRLDPFLWFVGHVLAHLPRFQNVYNDVLAQYKKVNRIRSRTHPVPPLDQSDGWNEAPFWIWRSGDSKRSRLFVKQVDRSIHLAIENESVAELPLAEDMDACCAVEVLRELPKKNIRLRPRALTATLFARLILADMFVHGIGGAKYDEMTDRIIQRFFGFPPPRFATVSATIHLPLGAPNLDATRRLEQLNDKLRRLSFQPERFVGADAAALVDEKQTLIMEQREAAGTDKSRHESLNERQSRRERFRRFQTLNAEMSRTLESHRSEIEQEISIRREQQAANGVLMDREFSLCLYPEIELREFLTSMT